MATDCRAIVTGVKGVTANQSRAGGIEIKFFTTSMQAGQDLLPLQGHNVVISIEALDRLLLEEQQQEATGTEDATPTPLRRSRSRRRAPASEEVAANSGP